MQKSISLLNKTGLTGSASVETLVGGKIFYSKLTLILTLPSLIKISFCLFSATALLACSGVKQMPKPCLEESRLIVEELCGSFTRGNQSEIDRMTVLSHYGFNEKDIGEIIQRSRTLSWSCPTTIRRQCGLIELRNGVGY